MHAPRVGSNDFRWQALGRVAQEGAADDGAGRDIEGGPTKRLERDYHGARHLLRAALSQ